MNAKYDIQTNKKHDSGKREKQIRISNIYLRGLYMHSKK